jgi:hypothetical protein
VAIWSTLELNIAIVCSCLGTLKPLISRFFPRLLSTTRTNRNVYIRQDDGQDGNGHESGTAKSRYATVKAKADHESQREMVARSADSVELSDFEANTGDTKAQY